MDDARFQEAKAAYDAGDYRVAAKGFLAAAGRGTDGNGAAYHMAGNALMRLRRYSDAVSVYRHALRDELYEKRAAARVNLASALVAQAEYGEAVEEYRAALEDPEYDAHYRALQGMAGAHMQMGHIEEAATAYRQAALDSGNPDPGKALNNLGLCFMALDRPGDAVEAYKAALGFDTYSGRGKALANLGIAFHALGLDAEAVKAFEKAIQLHGHSLSGQALEAFDRSQAALVAPTPEREVVEGWQTGEMPPVIESSMVGMSGFDDGATVEFAAIPGSDIESGTPGTGAVLETEEIEESAFFTRSDQDMREADRELRRAERLSRRETRNPWRTVVSIASVVVVVAGALLALYFTGLGFPTQAMTVDGLLEARAAGSAVDKYWVAVPDADVDKEMAKLPPVKEFQLGAIERAARTSRVEVTVTPDNGAPLRYEITLSREGVGWKVSGVANDWRTPEDD